MILIVKKLVVEYSLLGISSASEFYKPTFRNSMSVPSSWVGRNDAYRWLAVVFILGRGRADEVDWSNRKEGRSGGNESAPREWNGPFLREISYFFRFPNLTAAMLKVASIY
jgi:hypothetical protein